MRWPPTSLTSSSDAGIQLYDNGAKIETIERKSHGTSLVGTDSSGNILIPESEGSFESVSVGSVSHSSLGLQVRDGATFLVCWGDVRTVMAQC